MQRLFGSESSVLCPLRLLHDYTARKVRGGTNTTGPQVSFILDLAIQPRDWDGGRIQSPCTESHELGPTVQARDRTERVLPSHPENHFVCIMCTTDAGLVRSRGSG